MPVPYWDDQRILLAVLRAGSLLGAARVLGVSQPTIRRRIEALEIALGVALFTRCAAAVVPTQTALDLVPHLEAMERASSAFQRGVSADANALAGTVRLAASELLGVELLPTMLESLRTDHPMLSIELALSDRVEDLIEHEADIAIRTVKPTHDSLIARRLGVSKVGLYAKPEFLEANG
ncbi:TPA: LysR family transcriptional regulator, partial [Pseudomonas aeruginosa]|nr:LysR family transcriptional regulator [Pseudomonas aeruginosa]